MKKIIALVCILLASQSSCFAMWRRLVVPTVFVAASTVLQKISQPVRANCDCEDRLKKKQQQRRAQVGAHLISTRNFFAKELNKKADLPHDDYPCVFHAIKWSDSELLKFLVDEKASLSVPTGPDRLTPLAYAAKLGNHAMILLLLEHGAQDVPCGVEGTNSAAQIWMSYVVGKDTFSYEDNIVGQQLGLW